MTSQKLNSQHGSEAKGIAVFKPCGDEKAPLLPPPCQASTPESTELQGYFLMALSCIGFTAMSTCSHIAEQKFNFPVVSTLLIRGLVQSILSFLYIVLFLPFPETFSNLSRKQAKLLVFISFTGSVALVFYFASLQILPLGEAVTMFFCSPIFTMVLSSIFLGESITFTHSVSGAICFIGVFLVARPETDMSSAVSSHDRIIGSMFSVSGAFLTSVADVSTRSLGTGAHHMLLVFSLSILLTFEMTLKGITSPYELLDVRKEGALWAFIAALISLPALGCLYRAYQLCRAGPGSMIRNLDVPFSFLLGILLLKESPSSLRLLGSMFVVLGTLMIALRQVMQC